MCSIAQPQRPKSSALLPFARLLPRRRTGRAALRLSIPIVKYYNSDEPFLCTNGLVALFVHLDSYQVQLLFACLINSSPFSL
jgi:hypothetical protein